MSKEIQEFVEKLKDWKNNFPIQDYDYTKYDCEVANIAKWQKESNINELIKFWNEKIEEECFELKHPIYNDVVTRAIWSCNLDIFFNWIFFVDIKNKNPFLLGQVCSCVNFMFVQNNFMILDEGWDNLYIGAASVLSDFVCKNYLNLEHLDLRYKAAHFGFTLQNKRPAHFFTHFLNNFIFLENKKKVFSQNVYFKPKCALFDKRDDIVYFYPTTKMNANLNKTYTYVLQESLEDYYILTDKDQLKQDYDLTIWLGLPGERRAWLEQIDGAANILKHFNKYFNKIKVYIDGMTAYDGERKEYPENKALFLKVLNATKELLQKEYNNASINTNSYNDIYGINSKDYCGARYTLNSDICILDFDELKELKLQSQENTYDNHANALEKLNEIKSKEKLIVFKSLAGYDYRTKICYCNDCDIVISDSGTTALVPFEFHKKPGVVFYGDLSAHWINMSKNYASSAYQRVIDEKLVKQTDRKSALVWNYHIPPQHIYNLAAEVLEELSVAGKLKIKNLKMHRLDVPPVELIAKQYELEQTLKIKLPIESVALYGELEKQINTLVLHNNTTLNQALENINTNNALSSTLQHSLQTKDQTIQNLENKIKDIEFKLYFKTAKARIQNHLAYKLGSALIENSKSIFGYIRMPYVLSYIRDKHRLEQKRYEENIKRYPELTLPPLESYPDYKEALKEKECFTYKLGEALIRADKEWYKGGYIKFYFESRRMKKEFLQRKANE